MPMTAEEFESYKNATIEQWQKEREAHVINLTVNEQNRNAAANAPLSSIMVPIYEKLRRDALKRSIELGQKIKQLGEKTYQEYLNEETEQAAYLLSSLRKP